VTDDTEILESLACLAFMAVSAVFVGSIMTDKKLVKDCCRREAMEKESQFSL
jgi:hypothetical protein